MSTPSEPERPGNDETASNGPWGAPPPPPVPDDADQVPPAPSAPMGPPPAPPTPTPDEDATTVGIHEPYGTWLAAADRAAGANQPDAPGQAHGAGHGTPPPPAPTPQPTWEQYPDQAAPNPQKTEEERKRRKKIKRRIIIWVIVVLLIGALIAAAFITRSVLAKGKYGPQKQVEAYLQALVDGKASEATKLLDPNVTTDQRVLLSDDLYKATKGRPTDFSIDSSEVNGSSATVKADVVQDGKTDRLTFTLAKDGKRDVVFDSWKLDSGPQQGVEVGTVPAKVKVNGVQVELGKAAKSAKEDEATELPVLPGKYTFTAPKGSSYVTYGQDVQTDVRLDGEDGSQDPVSFTTSYTEKVYTDAAAQIEKKISGCTKDKDMFVESCLAASWEDTGWDATQRITRQWSSSPTVTLIASGQDGQTDTATSGASATSLEGTLSASLDGAQLHVDGVVRDARPADEDPDEWQPSGGDTFDPFVDLSGEPMVFPIKIDGNKLTVGGLDQIDRYDPDNINPNNRAKNSQYKTKE